MLILLEQLFHYEQGVSQKRLACRDIASTAVNVLVTGTVMRMVFVPLVVFLPELLFGRTLYFSSSAQLGPLWLQMILAMWLYSFLRYGIHRVHSIRAGATRHAGAPGGRRRRAELLQAAVPHAVLAEAVEDRQELTRRRATPKFNLLRHSCGGTRPVVR